MADRRRFNPPLGGTSAPAFSGPRNTSSPRTRNPSTPRKIFLKTGIVPSASGSAYLEQQAPSPSSTPNSHPTPTSTQSQITTQTQTFTSSTSSLKLIVTVHGPRPLPRNQPFSSTLVLNTHLKYAPFASRHRRGYIRDPGERDLSAHLESALRGVIIGERWPKSAVEVIVTVLEGEDDLASDGVRGLGAMNVLAGAITASSAALVDAGIDCVDLVSGGVAAIAGKEIVVDPAVGEGSGDDGLQAACVVGYLQARDEVTELWVKGDVGPSYPELIDRAVEAAALTRGVLSEILRDSTSQKLAVLERRAKEEGEKGQSQVNVSEVDMQ